MEQLREGNGGWVRYQSSDLSVPVFVRFADREGRLVVDELYVPSIDGAGIDTNLLRRVPLGRIEAWVNAPEFADGIRASMPTPGPDLRRAVSYFDRTASEEDHWVARMMKAQMAGSSVDQAPLRPISTELHEPDVVVDAKLKVPATRNKGDDFYRQVGDLYANLARYFTGPATLIAEHNKVPVTTVHRWVKEARRRGFLSPGRPGKAG